MSLSIAMSENVKQIIRHIKLLEMLECIFEEININCISWRCFALTAVQLKRANLQ